MTISLSALLTFVVNILKNKLNLSGKQVTALSAVIGAIGAAAFFGISFLTTGESFEAFELIKAAINGLVIGLAASGIYDLGFKVDDVTVTIPTEEAEEAIDEKADAK